MAPDLRLGNIQIDPTPAIVDEPLTFFAECLNVGDEGTGEFIARFVLDGGEEFEAPIGNVPPGATEWIMWPHDGLAGGDHVIRCVLDSRGAVAEPEERYNQLTMHFEVKAGDLPPQDSHGDAYFDEERLADAVMALARDRIQLAVTLTGQAIELWESESLQFVDDWSWDGDAKPDLGITLWTLATTFVSYVPGAGKIVGVVNDANSVYALLQQQFGQSYLGEDGAKARLRRAVTDLKAKALPALWTSIEGHEEALRAKFDPDSGDNPLTWVEKGSTDPDFVAQICDWIGVEKPTVENTVDPIKQELTTSFHEVLNDVARQLQREEGYDS